MNNVEIIERHISKGCTPKKRIGMELEHFVCDKNYNIISYLEMATCLEEIGNITGGQLIRDNGKVLGVDCGEYTITLEPGRQYEISISPRENVLELRKIYKKFQSISADVFARHGYEMINKGVFPLVENGKMDPSEIPILPKRRYHLMDKHFQNTGKYGRYMMRATASTQIAIDYKDMEDAMVKIRVLSKLSPIIALITENQNHIGIRKEWNSHILRTQIWNDLDPDRAGYAPGSAGNDYSFKKYAEYVYTKPSVLIQRGDEVIDLEGRSAAEYLEKNGKGEIDFTDHLLSMFFPNVRLKQYIEYRVADSMDIEQAVAYASLIKALMYDSSALKQLDKAFAHIDSETQIYEAEEQVSKYGYEASIYGRDIKEWISKIFDLAQYSGNDVINQAERNTLSKLKSAPVVRHEYISNVKGREDDHGGSLQRIKSYMELSTARNHGRAVNTLYIPKLYTKNEVDIFQKDMKVLFTIFKKVIWMYRNQPEYRRLFDFQTQLEELILLPDGYAFPIPMSRIDLFFDENTNQYKFCEFNTDGTSAMNEDRELVSAFNHSKAQAQFRRNHDVASFELFDTWIDQVLEDYGEYSHSPGAVPNVAIVDFLENGTVSEFEVFKSKFIDRRINTQICDIRDLKWDGKHCTTPSKMKVDVIYRRAVTADVMEHYEAVQPFIAAVKAGAVCLIGEFKTQIVHNKKLFKVIQRKETLEFLNRKEREFVKAHFPRTITLSLKELEENQDVAESIFADREKWIVKPEDSYGAKGVYAGIDCSEAVWKREVEAVMGRGYIAQEYVPPYREENFDGSRWKGTSNLAGLYFYGGKFTGVYSRVSFDNIISTEYNEIALPTFIVK